MEDPRDKLDKLNRQPRRYRKRHKARHYGTNGGYRRERKQMTEEDFHTPMRDHENIEED